MDTSVSLLHFPTYKIDVVSLSLGGNRAIRSSSRTQNQRDFQWKLLNSFCRASTLKEWAMNDLHSLLPVYLGVELYYTKSACSCRSRAQWNMPTFSHCESRCGWNCWQEARAEGQMQIFHISFFKCLFQLRQGWYLARKYYTNLMKGVIGWVGTEASVTYSSS